MSGLLWLFIPRCFLIPYFTKQSHLQKWWVVVRDAESLNGRTETRAQFISSRESER